MMDQRPSDAFERPSPRAGGELSPAPAPLSSFPTSSFSESRPDWSSADAPVPASSADEPADFAAGVAPEAAGDGALERRPRRRRRGGRGRRRNQAPPGVGDQPPQDFDAPPAALPELPAERAEWAAEDGAPSEPDDQISAPSTAGEAPGPDSAGGLDEQHTRRRRRGRRGGRRKRHAGQALDNNAPDNDEADPAAPVEAPIDATVAALDGDALEPLPPDAVLIEPELPVDGPDVSGRRSRRRRGRRGRGAQRGERSLPQTPEPGARSDDDQPELARAAPAEVPQERAHGSGDDPRGRRRRRRGRGRDRERERERAPAPAGPVEVELIPGDDDELPSAEREQPEPSAHAREQDDLDDLDVPRVKPGRKNVILVNAADREETRVGVVVDGQLVDFLMHVKRHEMLVNDIYRGKVVNLEPAIGAAFVDFGQGRNGFLHTSDVLSAYGEEDWSLDKLLTTKIDPDEWDEKSGQPEVGTELGDTEHATGSGEPAREEREPQQRRKPHHGGNGRHRARPRLPITDLLEKGQSVVVQVTKDAIGDKGPTLTTYISIPGRYLVLMPSMARTGVSRKIEDDKERRRLKRILESLEIPAGMGVIVRTAGVGCTRAEIQRDLDYLLLLWNDFGKRLNLGRGPVALYEESDVAIRTIRDLFNDHTEAVIVDDERVYQRVRDFVTKLMPEKLDLIRLHAGPKPLFHTHNIEQDFERIFARRIDLPSGGSIVFDQAEALVAIDVNSGKTRTDGFDFEQVALRTNLDAVAEIARQIRLRDLGGIIVCDFIDMQRGSARRQVERGLRDALASDRARSKLGRISQFGLLELTRQRLGPGLSKMLFHNCPRCRGSGKLRTVESRVGAILRRLGSALTLKGFSKVEVRAAPDVIALIKRNYATELRDLGVTHEREIELVPVTDQIEDSVLRYLRTDGREVRPGGRRKR
jgi:ribonuclease E